MRGFCLSNAFAKSVTIFEQHKKVNTTKSDTSNMDIKNIKSKIFSLEKERDRKIDILKEFKRYIDLLYFIKLHARGDKVSMEICDFYDFSRNPPILKTTKSVLSSKIPKIIKKALKDVAKIESEIEFDEIKIADLNEELNYPSQEKEKEQKELERKEQRIFDFEIEKQELANEHELKKMEILLQIEETKLLREREEREANRSSIDSLKDSIRQS